ncbi:MAG: TraB/GumN family protein [Pseudomonadota bacterium]
MKSSSVISASLAAITLLAANPAFADDHAQTAATTLPSGPEGPALWKVTDDDTTIYLFGTVHALDPSVQWYDAEIDAALQSSGTIVTEILMDPQSEAAMQQLALSQGVFTDGTTLRSLLDADQLTTYEAALGGMGVPAGAFDQLEPWMAGLTLTFLPLMQQGYDLQAGVDKVILSKSGGKPVDALETAEFQLGIFDGLPIDKQVEFMMAAVEGIDEIKVMLDAMVAEWLAGDAEGLAEIMNEGLEDETLASALLYERNANWAEWIDTRMDEPGTVFIAVGAGHLAGDKSVQDYLAERGIATDRIQ